MILDSTNNSKQTSVKVIALLTRSLTVRCMHLHDYKLKVYLNSESCMNNATCYASVLDLANISSLTCKHFTGVTSAKPTPRSIHAQARVHTTNDGQTKTEEDLTTPPGP